MPQTTFEPVSFLDVSDKDASRLIALVREKAEAMGVPVVVCVYSVRDRVKQLAWMDGAPQRSQNVNADRQTDSRASRRSSTGKTAALH